MNLDLHKELYFFEWGRKEQLSAAANLPVALLTGLAGGMFYLLQSFPYERDAVSVAFGVAGGLSVLSLLAAIGFLFQSVLRYKYQQLPPSDQLQEHFEKLKDWHDQYGTEADCKQDFEQYLQDRLGEANAANMAANTKVADALVNATRALLFALVFAALSLLPYFPSALEQKSQPSAMKIEGPVRIESEAPRMAQEKQGPPPQGQTPQGQPQPTATPATPKPTGPPNHIVPLEATAPTIPSKPVGPSNVEVQRGGGSSETK